MTLPATNDETLLVRTCFEDPAAWDRLRTAVMTPSPGDGFLAGVRIVDDPSYADMSPSQLVALVPDSAPAECLFVVDHLALTHDDGPILTVPRVPAHWDEELLDYAGDRAEFRVAVAYLWMWRTTCAWRTWTGRSSPTPPTLTGSIAASDSAAAGTGNPMWPAAMTAGRPVAEPRLNLDAPSRFVDPGSGSSWVCGGAGRG
ncbi:MAG: DUF6924 domain-containing protein [Pseudonocardiaceae bacterium]